MPNILQHHSASVTKAIFIGESGTGKTGALASLAAAGFQVRVLDFDNGMDILRNLLDPKSGKYGPDAYKNLSYVTLTEKFKIVAGSARPPSATVWPRAVKMMEGWQEKDESGNVVNDFGPVMSWTPKDVLVIDTLSGLGKAAYNYILSLNGKLLSGAQGHEHRRVLNQAQQLVEDFVMMLCAKEFNCNVIMNTHITFVDEPGSIRTSETDNIPQVGLPNIIGQALSNRLPRYFNNTLMSKKIGTMHKIYTKTPLNINLKSSAPTKLKQEYPLESGLAEIFKTLQEGE